MSGMIRLSCRKWLLPNCCHEENGIVDQASSHECRSSGPRPSGRIRKVFRNTFRPTQNVTDTVIHPK